MSRRIGTGLGVAGISFLHRKICRLGDFVTQCWWDVVELALWTAVVAIGRVGTPSPLLGCFGMSFTYHG